jgi:hypothetical protein
VESCRPTLLIDEADTFLAEAEELRGIVNSGHRWGGAVVRTVGDDYEPRAFSTYGACAIALIGKLPATLHDRSVVIDLKRRLRSETITSFRSHRTGELDVLARKAARWAADNADRIKGADPEDPAGIFNRDADNWRPLLAIAEVAGDDCAKRAREVGKLCCAAAASDDASSSLLEVLLTDIRDVFTEKKKDQMSSVDLVQALVDLEGHPWAEMGKSRKPLTQTRLARLLKGPGFCIAPERITERITVAGQDTEMRLRGYVLAHFEEVFSRYLGAEGDSTCPSGTNADRTGTSSDSQRVQEPSAGHVEKCEKSNNGGLLDTWTRSHPPIEAREVPGPVAGVPFMVTRAMVEKLRKLGLTAEQIARLTPQEAHDRPSKPAPDRTPGSANGASSNSRPLTLTGRTP